MYSDLSTDAESEDNDSDDFKDPKPSTSKTSLSRLGKRVKEEKKVVRIKSSLILFN